MNNHSFDINKPTRIDMLYIWYLKWWYWYWYNNIDVSNSDQVSRPQQKDQHPKVIPSYQLTP